MTDMTTHTLEVPGAILTYDVRPNESSTKPVLLMIGSPMGAAGFATLAGFFTDRTVVTYDPRMSDRSHRTDGATQTTVEEQADDLHRLIEALGAGPVDLFASSGGAVNALALVAKHPEQVRQLVAHEPPSAAVLPDAEAALAAAREVHDVYIKDGRGAGMAKFLALTMHKGEIPADRSGWPPADPAMFGIPAEDDGSRDDPLMGQTIISVTGYTPDFDALRGASTRIVIAAGVESAMEMAHRGAFAVAQRLGKEPVMFPSHHGGFLSGEFGWPGEPEMFAANLREVLADGHQGAS
ncbi:MAG TPA: alpha/beta hydrolase [Methylomirabilota bacterium]|jgi:pimeloyl-ACP methyl ester carboxylesterase|nr:alpha/beta hydrolase [Methylomirabilota bacterium]